MFARARTTLQHSFFGSRPMDTITSFFGSAMSSIQRPSLQPAPAQRIRDAPRKQPYFTFAAKYKTWVSSEDCTTGKAQHDRKDDGLGISPLIITVLTWNIDFMRPLPTERMSAALSYLKAYLLSSIGTGNAVVILLQEMVASDLHLIKSAPWIRERFHITDRSPQNWESGHYGTCTLVEKRLQLKDVFRVHYQATRMGRDALFVDIAVPSTGSREDDVEEQPPTSTMPGPNTPAHRNSDKKTIRIGNTHLESLRADPPLRDLQLSSAARFMRQPDIHASIIGGDLNAIEPFDRTLHTDCGLKDAYLELGGQEDSEVGYTWGQMAERASRERYGCCRMDKVFFVGGVDVQRLERVGMGVQVEGEKEKEMLKGWAGLEEGWVTDHLGVRVDLEVVD